MSKPKTFPKEVFCAWEDGGGSIGEDWFLLANTEPQGHVTMGDRIKVATYRLVETQEYEGRAVALPKKRRAGAKGGKKA